MGGWSKRTVGHMKAAVMGMEKVSDPLAVEGMVAYPIC
jgi:hypothetical protein